MRELNWREVVGETKELELGVKHEDEHKETFDKVKKYYEDKGEWPSYEEFYQWTAEDHLKEIKDYYSRLDKMEEEYHKEQDNG